LAVSITAVLLNSANGIGYAITHRIKSKQKFGNFYPVTSKVVKFTITYKVTGLQVTLLPSKTEFY